MLGLLALGLRSCSFARGLLLPGHLLLGRGRAKFQLCRKIAGSRVYPVTSAGMAKGRPSSPRGRRGTRPGQTLCSERGQTSAEPQQRRLQLPGQRRTQRTVGGQLRARRPCAVCCVSPMRAVAGSQGRAARGSRCASLRTRSDGRGTQSPARAGRLTRPRSSAGLPASRPPSLPASPAAFKSQQGATFTALVAPSGAVAQRPRPRSAVPAPLKEFRHDGQSAEGRSGAPRCQLRLGSGPSLPDTSVPS